MELKKLEENIDRLSVLAVLYEEILNSKFSAKSEEELGRLKLKYARSEILKILMENRKILQMSEAEEKPE